MVSEASLPDDYPQLLEQLKAQVRASRASAHRVVDTELLQLYWTIGNAILNGSRGRGGARR
jgi:hypothetical protein